MLDPYMVLGVGKYDDDQTVKKAYRQLSKQYHPDNNLNNPNKDAAEETFKKIQQAYEQIMHERSLGIGGPNDVRRNKNESSGYNSGNSSYQSSSYNSGDSSYQSDSYNSWDSGYRSNAYNSGSSDRSNSYSSGDGGYRSSSYSSNQSNSYNSGDGGYRSNSYSSNQSNSYNSGDSSYQSDSYNSWNSSYRSNGYNSGNSSYQSSGNSNSSRGGYYSGKAEYKTKDRYDNSWYKNSAFNSANNSGYYTGNAADPGYGNSSGYYGPESTDSFFTEDTDAFLAQVADKLNNRNFYDAWDILNSMQNRNDVWYYYSAIANLGLGNSITALSHARRAKEMQPDRPEYDELINGIQSGALHYQGRSDMFVPQKANKGNICLKLIIANIALNIFCGGGGAICNGFCAFC